MYCSECGTEVTQDASFCPECGSAIEQSSETQHSPQSATIEGETGTCEKCDSIISVEADRCPECGYEPASSGIISGLFSIVCLIWAGIGLILFLAAFAVLFSGGYSIVNFILALGLITLFSGIPVGYLYGMYKKAQIGPTETVEIFGSEVGGDN